MSDYAQLQEQLAIALGEPEALGVRQTGEVPAYSLDRQKRNPPPPPEPALFRARTQAEWHQVQQALVLAETPPEELAMAMGVSDGVPPSEQQGERMHEQRAQQSQERIETAKKDLEGWRSGKAPDLRGPRSALSPASTPGYVPAPVQGQVPPLPGEALVAPDHAQAHQRIAAAHRQAAGIHQAEAQAQPANAPQHAEAAATHEQQAQMHDTDAQGTPNAPSTPVAEQQPAQDQAAQDKEKAERETREKEDAKKKEANNKK